MSEIEREVLGLLRELCSRPEIPSGARLVADLGIDSVKTLDLLMALEQRVGEISEVEAARLVTVHDVLALCRKRA